MESEDRIVFKLIGTNAQILEVSIEPDKTIIADGGMLLYLDEEITHETRPDDGYVPPKPEPEIEEEVFEEPPPPKKEPVIAFEEVPLPTRASPKKQAKEEDETDGTFLEKLWKATRKTIANIGQKIQDTGGKKKEEEPPPPQKKPEPEPEKSFADVFDEPPPKKEPEPEPEAEPEPEPEPAISWFLTYLHNPSEYIRRVGFTTTHGGLVVPIVLDELEENTIIFQTGTFLCARKGIRLEVFLDTEISVNFTEGKLFKLDKISGEGMIFLRGEGQVLRREMENDAIKINLFSLLAYESTLALDTSSISLIDSMNYEDQTQFALLSGTGRYWIQTANLQHLIYRIAPVVFEPPKPETIIIEVPVPAKEEPKPEPVKEKEPEPEAEKAGKEDSPEAEDAPAGKPKKGGDDEEPDMDIDKIVEEL